jgi:hypothetical protein
MLREEQDALTGLGANDLTRSEVGGNSALAECRQGLVPVTNLIGISLSYGYEIQSLAVRLGRRFVLPLGSQWRVRNNRT